MQVTVHSRERGSEGGDVVVSPIINSPQQRTRRRQKPDSLRD